MVSRLWLTLGGFSPNREHRALQSQHCLLLERLQVLQKGRQ